MKARQDPGLSLRIEIHQGVAAHQQIQVRDGSILNQIVAPKDNGAAKVGAEDVAPPNLFKVFILEVSGDGLHFLDAVTALAGLAEGILIHIGGIDLDLLAEGLLPRGLAQQHGYAVSFFARGAAGAPHSDKVAFFLA